ncbi:hypothetical protein SAMN00768000_3736 [Sulfobacillus thermosulfidooxidans DSM 9293]|uniref:Uncharacterized protein n=1 Tax=Sulfobacillus thermosulfidooxidans (strain DSM 9293 / VKM B-1269 / AT-1) TaxID=929705 RepID=A0A1W1WPG3_SULTA|nr:hypothetical protein [Sulfobacillus thermosulfidooxidans]SMC08197.1 hypothetical protein SAMN00768000_3736 [Sulfobacillus thermosulfidooxidans DSM 9293]
MEDRPDLGGWRIDEIDEDNVPYEPVSAPPPRGKVIVLDRWVREHDPAWWEEQMIAQAQESLLDLDDLDDIVDTYCALTLPRAEDETLAAITPYYTDPWEDVERLMEQEPQEVNDDGDA